MFVTYTSKFWQWNSGKTLVVFGLPGLTTCPWGYRKDDFSELWNRWIGSGGQMFEGRNWLTKFQVPGCTKSGAYEMRKQPMNFLEVLCVQCCRQEIGLALPYATNKIYKRHTAFYPLIINTMNTLIIIYSSKSSMKPTYTLTFS